ncbi:hypothetical protein JCM19000A_33280 [Silvimonas sp. JCM 19000]
MPPALAPGASAATSSTSGLSVASQILQARFRLLQVLEQAESISDFPQRVTEIAQQIQLACMQDSDVALAVILHAQEGGYGVRHAADTATVVEIVARRVGMPLLERQSVVCAALTMNIAMLALQEALTQQAGPLTPAQRMTMQEHPQLGRDMLRGLGVADLTWLDCVLQHHEAPDGSGYPAKLSGEQIRFEARLIGLADRYSAMLTQSAWRKASAVDNAMFESLAQNGGVDAKFGALFRETIGVYPPGAVVQLRNGEVAVVRHAGDDDHAPSVVSLLDAKGNPLPDSPPRDTAQAGYQIAHVLDPRLLAGRLRSTHVWGATAAGL